MVRELRAENESGSRFIVRIWAPISTEIYEITVPKLYPRFDNGAFLALLAALRINNLRRVNTVQ